MLKPMILIVMGVSGCGKTTVGELLAKNLGISFFDGDHYHSKANVAKMSKGIALTDVDRKAWLNRLNKLALAHIGKGAVIACSALKLVYRDALVKNLNGHLRFVYLKGTQEQILGRLQLRKNHYMPPGLLASQYEALEPPIGAIEISIDQEPLEMVAQIIDDLKR